MDRWLHKVALVTGASAGIGSAIVESLVRNGMKVVGCARNGEKLQEIASKVNAEGKGEMFPYTCDLVNEDEILGMFQFIKEKFGTIHVCVNNAGLGHIAPLISGKTSDWREMLDVNVIALCVVTREAYLLMKNSKVDDGHIININGMSGHRVPSDHVYSSTKFAVTALTEGLRQELREARTHIRSTAISPGLVRSEFVARQYKDDVKGAESLFSNVKCLEPSDVADAVVFVLSSPPHMEVNDVLMRPVEEVF